MNDKKLKKRVRHSSARQVFLTLAALFALGSVAGWIFEFFVRGIDGGSWVNPGFLHGPYLPIYGFGVACMYLLTKLPLPIANKPLKAVVQILVVSVALTLIEYIGGLIFVKGFRIPLWDYSHAKGNIQGLICPLCSLVWTGASAVYVLFLHKWIKRLEGVIHKRVFPVAIVAFFYGALSFDCIFTIFL